MVDWPQNPFLERLGTEHPIIQAPMAGASGTSLCLAAIEGGALGSLPCAMLSGDEVLGEVAAVRAQTPKPFALNFFCHAMPERFDDKAWRELLRPYYEEFSVKEGPSGTMRLPFDEAMATLVEQLKPPVVTFHFGLPRSDLMARVKATGALIIGNATTPEEARWLEERGVDAIIAQGFEAGGHSGSFLGSDPAEALGLFALVQLILNCVSVPVIAAGAISSGRAIAAALTLGASAVQIGTAFLHTPEAAIKSVHRTALANGHTLFTNLMTGGLARGLHGRLIDDLGPVRSEAPPYPLASTALAPLRSAAEQSNEYGFSPMWAGQASPLGQSISATELTRELAAEALKILGRRGKEREQ